MAAWNPGPNPFPAGKIDDINQPDESIAVADFLTAARVYYLSALAVCGAD